jgi:hypothetical protein
VLEDVVRDAIIAGRVLWDRPRGFALITLDEGGDLVALARRARSPLTGRKAWLVTDLRQTTKKEGATP